MEYGLLGEKLGHSFSPQLHKALAGYDYRLLPTPPEAVEELLRRREFKGLNVTIPYKQTVIPLCDRVDPRAAAIGAVNTVVNRGGRLTGYNTDMAILSRCVVLNMKPVADSRIKAYLCDILKVPDYRAEVCAAFARGNVGKAKMLATSEEFENIKAEALALLKYIQDMDLNEIVAAVKKITEYKLEIKDYLDICAIWYRDALLFKATSDMNHLIFREEIQALRRTAQRSSYEGIENIIKALDTAKRRLDANVNFELVMELLMLAIQENS